MGTSSKSFITSLHRPFERPQICACTRTCSTAPPRVVMPACRDDPRSALHRGEQREREGTVQFEGVVLSLLLLTRKHDFLHAAASCLSRSQVARASCDVCSTQAHDTFHAAHSA